MLKKKRNIIDMCQEDGGTDRSTFRRVHRGEISGQIQGEILTNNFDFGGKIVSLLHQIFARAHS